MPEQSEEKKPKKKPSAAKKKLKKLVIVESPSKANTIKKYLGRGYEVMASVGHIIDLPKSRLAVNLETFDPDYIVMRDKSKVMKEIRQAAKSASEIILASDPDREGEAIAWHIRNDLEKRITSKIKSREIPIKRIRFEEITKPAVLSAIEKPMEINELLVQAQQGRRVIDRIFGYQLSPLLWKKVKSKLSAGRVQSIALRLVCEREDKIEKFNPQEYWTLDADYAHGKSAFTASLVRIAERKVVSPTVEMDEILLQAEKDKLGLVSIDDKQVVIQKEFAAQEIEAVLKKEKSTVSDIRERVTSRKANAPFITSTLQQTANNLLNYTSIKTMRFAQQLYEGIDIGSTRTGLITYMRTDSTRISPIAMEAVRNFIGEEYGADYLPETPNSYKNRKSAQDAHEAIRPTDVTLTPEKVKKYLSGEQYKLYRLIWKRFVASQMTPSKTKQVTVEVKCDEYILTSGFSNQVFDGFTKVFDYSKSKKSAKIPKDLKIGEEVDLKDVLMTQKFTEPPARYTDASLVRIMEELGIGRPSTYAPTIYTLTKRYYVQKQGKALVPTDLGKIVNSLLVENFPNLISADFTAKMEEELDEVEAGDKEWKTVVKDFYGPFEKVLSAAYENIDEIKGIFDEPTDFVCEKCGKPMVKKLGRFGFFLACSGWPDCRNTKDLPLGKCPKCEDGYVVKKRGKKGRTFYGCSNYPDCDFATFDKPSEESCPNDGSALFYKKINREMMLICHKEGCGYEKPSE